MCIRFALIALVLCLVAWSNNPGASTTTNDAKMVNNGVVYFDWDTNITGTDSGWLDVSLCSFISMGFDPDVGTAGTGATIHIRETSDPTLACASGDLVVVDRNGDGVLDGTDEVVWSGPTGARGFTRPVVQPHICVDAVGDGTPDDSRVSIKCLR